MLQSKRGLGGTPGSMANGCWPPLKLITYWREARGDPEFEKEVESVTVVYVPDFGIAALQMILRLNQNGFCFLLDMASEEAELFVMMLGMGFFTCNGQFYRMTTPSRLTVSEVKIAVLRYAKTEDEEFVLHPESLVTAMPFSDAEAWQRRVLALDEFQNDWPLGPLRLNVHFPKGHGANLG